MRLRQRLQRLEAVFTRDDDAEVVSVDCYWDDGKEYIGTMKVAHCHIIKTHKKRKLCRSMVSLSQVRSDL